MGFDQLKEQFENSGEYKFYNKILYLALEKVVSISAKSFKGTYPHIEYINYYEKLYILYKQEGDETYLKMAKLFRKASNKIYRLLLKKNLVEKNNKFLNVI